MTPARFRPPKQRRLRAGPFIGVRDTKDATAADPTRAQALVNVYARDPQQGGALLGRPGVTRTGVAQGALGAGANHRVQGIASYRRLNGTTYTVAVVAGTFATYDWSADTWTAVTLTGGAALNAAASAVYFTVFADLLVVSDGVNPPWTWNGTTTTVLVNAPVLYGQPWVHAARLWGIKNSDRVTIAWSEPNQPDVGWEATIGSGASAVVYKNAWTLGQTAQGALVAGRGFNDRMVLWRARSTTEVYGLVDSAFSTAATRESRSETIGCAAPGAVTVVDGAAYWLSADQQLCVLRPGYAVETVDDLSEAPWDVTTTAIGGTLATADPLTHCVLVALPLGGATIPQDCWALHTQADLFQGTWTGWGAMTALATVVDATGTPVRMHGGVDGWIYRHGYPRGVLWDDALASGTQPIAHSVRTPPLGWDEDAEKFWDKVTFACRARTSISNVAVQPIGPYGYGVAQVVNAHLNGARWDEAQFDTGAQFMSEGIDQHLPVGLETHGRWQQFEVRHATLGEQFGLLTVQAWVQDVTTAPEVA